MMTACNQAPQVSQEELKRLDAKIAEGQRCARELAKSAAEFEKVTGKKLPRDTPTPTFGCRYIIPMQFDRSEPLPLRSGDSGWQAGYDWAIENDINDTAECANESSSFEAGCIAAVEGGSDPAEERRASVESDESSAEDDGLSEEADDWSADHEASSAEDF